MTITEQFARSMSLGEALNHNNLLCYEMNGDALPHANGFPVRLIAPGWYGVANVKWLTRIEVMDHRYAGNFTRDYVSIREEQRDGQTVWTFATVSHERLKSAPSRPPFVISHSLMKNLPDQTAKTMGNRPDGLLVAEARQQPPKHDLKYAAFDQYRYVRKTETSAAYYEVIEAEAQVVRLVFETYTQQGVSINAIARMLNQRQIPTRTAKTRWERSTVWGILRNPAYQPTEPVRARR